MMRRIPSLSKGTAAILLALPLTLGLGGCAGVICWRCTVLPEGADVVGAARAGGEGLAAGIARELLQKTPPLPDAPRPEPEGPPHDRLELPPLPQLPQLSP